MSKQDIIRHLRLRLPDCGEGLCSHYADQVLSTGGRTTAEDAFEAWGRWVGPHSYRSTDWLPDFHGRVAIVIREVSRYAAPRSEQGKER